MADEIDNANDLADLHLEAAIYNASRVTGKERLTGMCHWCKYPTHGMFCSPECCDDYNRMQRNKQ